MQMKGINYTNVNITSSIVKAYRVSLSLSRAHRPYGGATAFCRHFEWIHPIFMIPFFWKWPETVVRLQKKIKIWRIKIRKCQHQDASTSRYVKIKISQNLCGISVRNSMHFVPQGLQAEIFANAKGCCTLYRYLKIWPSAAILDFRVFWLYFA